MTDLYNKPDRGNEEQQLKARLACSGDEIRRLQDDIDELLKLRKEWQET